MLPNELLPLVVAGGLTLALCCVVGIATLMNFIQKGMETYKT